MRVFTTVPQEDLRRVGAAARGAEAEGYDGIVAMENKHDPFLALAVAGAADFLVTGDKQDLLSLKLYEGTRIITVRDFLTMNRRLP